MEEPKPAVDDPQAPERIRELLASPTYRQADKDLEFHESEDTRGVRAGGATALAGALRSTYRADVRTPARGDVVELRSMRAI